MRGATRRGTRPPYGWVLGGLVALLVAAVLVAASVGAVAVPLNDVARVLLRVLYLPAADPGRFAEQVVLHIRLPRILVAALAGAAFAVAGTFLSGALRNPLAEPVTTGTAAGALLGTSAVVFLSSASTAHLVAASVTVLDVALRVAVATAVAFVATLAVLAATVRQGGRVLAGPLLLAGLAVNAVVGSVAALLLFTGTAGTQTAATLVVSWTFGGLLDTAGRAEAVLLWCVLFVLAIGWLWLRRPLDLLTAGEEEAAAGGLDVDRARLVAIGFASLATGAAVAAAGVVAFVGLVAPFVLRRWTGASHLRLLPAAALLGAVFLVAADAAGRVLGAPAEVPAGVVTAALGAPVLLVLLARRTPGVGA